MGAFQALVTIVGLIGIVALLILLFCRYLGGWTWTQAWLTSTREEKLVLTRSGVGHYNPNGYMIPSESDLNLSGGGSFRRFDKADQDYQLLRQGSHSSTNRGPPSQGIPPQPLRPAPIPPSIGQVQQQSTDSVFTAPSSPSPFPPTPKIPPPPQTHSSSGRSSGGGGSDPSSAPPLPQPSTTSSGAAPFNFSSTNPFLPLLQASSNFFSQTISNIGNGNVSGIFSNSDDAFSPGVATASTTTESRTTFDSTGGTDGSCRPSQSLSHSYDDSAPFGSLSSTSTMPSTSGLSMGEIIFSAPPVYPLKDIYQQTALQYEYQTAEAQNLRNSGPSSIYIPPQAVPLGDPFGSTSGAISSSATTLSSVTVTEKDVGPQGVVSYGGAMNSFVRDEQMRSEAPLHHPYHSEDSTERIGPPGIKHTEESPLSFPFFGRTPFGREATNAPSIVPTLHPISTENKILESRGTKVNDLVQKSKEILDPLRRHSVAACNADEVKGKTEAMSHMTHSQLQKLKQDSEGLSPPAVPPLPGNSNQNQAAMTFFSGRFEHERGQRQYLYGAGEDLYPTAASSSIQQQENEEELTNRKMLETMREEIRLENEWMEDATKSLMDERFNEVLTVSSPPPPSPARRAFDEKSLTGPPQHHSLIGKDPAPGGGPSAEAKRRSSLSITAATPAAASSQQMPLGMPTRKFSLASYSPPKSLFSFEPRGGEPLSALVEASNRFTATAASQPSATPPLNYRNSTALLLNQKSQNPNKNSNLSEIGSVGGSVSATGSPSVTAGNSIISVPSPIPSSSSSPMASATGINQVVAGPSSHSSSYRNRSFSLRQSSTDSIGSDISDLGSPEGAALPSLQRAMSCDSVCSDTSVVLGDLDPPHLTGHLCVGLEYDCETADLLVNVMEAKELVGLDPDPAAPFDSYVRVFLLPDKTTNMQTRVYRKSLNPVYKEKFMFGLEITELPTRSLVFYLYATNKFSNTLIGEAELKLGDVDVHQSITTWLPLTDTGQRGGEFGELMFSLSYLPTAERLTVVVVKARNLKFPHERDAGDPFVKVYLLQRGKKVSKKKSSTKRCERNPIFNEAMIFSVPPHALQSIQLRITVAESAEAEMRAYSIGHVIVGSVATGKPLSHWNQMLSSLRKPIAMWHHLRR